MDRSQLGVVEYRVGTDVQVVAVLRLVVLVQRREERPVLREAGDVDVLQRAEILQNMMQDFPVIQNTPLALKFLSDYMRLRYPGDLGRQYSDALLQGDPKKQLIMQLNGALQAAIKPEDLANMNPQEKGGLQQLMAQTQQVLAGP